MCSRLEQNGNTSGKGLKARFRDGQLFENAAFAGCARKESLGWWKRQGAEEVMVEAQKYAERNKVTKELTWFDVPAGEVVAGVLEQAPPGKDYRLLKVATRPATPEEFSVAGNDRFPLTVPADPA